MKREQIIKAVLLCAVISSALCSSNDARAQCCTNGVNLLASYNPDFSIVGDPEPPGFQTDNVYSPFLSAGLYSVIVSRDYGACFGNPQYDHTFGNQQGAYLWYDTEGNTTVENPEVAWRPYDPLRPPGQENTLDVSPNTTYVFSVWIRDLAREPDCVSGGAPVMGLRINGVDMAEIDLGEYTSPCCPEWVYLCTEWYSGNATEVLIEIESRSGLGWTDLGIDDVYFGSTSPFQQGILGADISTCTEETVTLNTGILFGNFLWSTGETSSSIEVDTPGIYWVDVEQEGCSGRDSIEVILGGAGPTISLGEDINVCEGSAQTLEYISDQVGDVVWSTGEVGSSIQVSATGNYGVTIINACGSASDVVAVNFISPPVISVAPSSAVLCGGDEVQLVATSGGNESITWNTGVVSNALLVNIPGQYQATISNACGTISATVEVENGAIPVIDLGDNLTLCVGDEWTIGVALEEVDYLWNTGATTPQINVTTSGIYSLTATNVCGSTTDQVEVTFASPIDIDLGLDTLACQGDVVTLEVGAENANVVWSTGASTTSLAITESGVYTVWVNNGCEVTDQVQVDFISAPVVSFPDTIFICQNEPLWLDAGGADFWYLWSDGSADSSFLVTSEGVVWVEVSNECGTANDQVTVVEPAQIEFPQLSDTVLCAGDIFSVTLDTLDFPWTWENGSIQNERTFDQPGQYQLLGNNGCGSYSESFSIVYRFCDCQVFIPNAFTPDNDGLNDTFCPSTECSFDRYELTIYNRWGEAFFVSTQPNEVWTGGVGDFFAPDGVYTYELSFRIEGGDLEIKRGFVILMR